MPTCVASASLVGAAEASLRELGYAYNNRGELRSISDGERFQFVDQAHYDKIGDAVTEYLYASMQETFGMSMVPLPKSAGSLERDSIPVFVSKNYLTAKKLLVLVQGSGAVMPGMWARAICINDFLDAGSVFPLLKDVNDRSADDEWGVVVANMNQWVDKNGVRIHGLSSMSENGQQFFKDYVQPAQGKLYILAHSAGGAVTSELVNQEWIRERTEKIALTDSVHMFSGGSDHDEWWRSKAKHWVASAKPLGESMGRSDCTTVSAGHTSHPWTTFSALEEIRQYFF